MPQSAPSCTNLHQVAPNCTKLHQGFFTQLHKLRSLRRSFPHFHFISAIHIWIILYTINTHFFHGNIWTHNWPAPNVSGFIGQLVEHRTGITRSRVQTAFKSWIFFKASLRNCINCVHCDDHVFIFKLHQVSPNYIMLPQSSPSCTKLPQSAPSRPNLHQVALSWPNLHEVEPTCTKLHQLDQPAPNFTKLP